jgi:hypothetical protein
VVGGTGVVLCSVVIFSISSAKCPISATRKLVNTHNWRGNV